MALIFHEKTECTWKMAEQPPMQTKMHSKPDGAVCLVRHTWESTGIPKPIDAQYPALHHLQYSWQDTMDRTGL